LIGTLALTSTDPATGFILLSARCSYELVEKTVRAGCPLLVTISAPTSLAVDRAVAAGLTLVSLARADSALVLNDPHGSIA
jgi:FdhD protein